MSRTPRSIQIQVMAAHNAVGGGALHARGIAQGLRRAGVRVSLLCTGGGTAGDLDYDELLVRRPKAWPLLWRFPPLGSMPFWYRTMPRTTAHVDAVVALSPVMAVATRWALPQITVLYCPAILDRAAHPDTRQSPLNWFERQAFRRAQGVLFTSEAVREAAEVLYCSIRVPVGICPLGVDRHHALQVTKTRAELGIPPEARLLLTVGLVHENKGQRYIARALARCAKPDWWWAILGEGPDQARVRGALRGSVLEPRTLFVGREPNPGSWFAAADLLVASSRSETFGLAIGEALQAGLPVVIPNNQIRRTLSPLAESVRKHGLGRTFDRRDTASLANALTAALGDDRELKKMGRRAAAFASANFSWDRYAANILELAAGCRSASHRLRSEVRIEARAGELSVDRARAR